MCSRRAPRDLRSLGTEISDTGTSVAPALSAKRTTESIARISTPYVKGRSHPRDGTLHAPPPRATPPPAPTRAAASEDAAHGVHKNPILANTRRARCIGQWKPTTYSDELVKTHYQPSLYSSGSASSLKR